MWSLVLLFDLLLMVIFHLISNFIFSFSRDCSDGDLTVL